MSRFESNNNNCAELYNITDWKNDGSIFIAKLDEFLPIFVIPWIKIDPIFYFINPIRYLSEKYLSKNVTFTQAKFKQFFPGDYVLLLLKTYTRREANAELSHIDRKKINDAPP